jgi:hypothetical protein
MLAVAGEVQDNTEPIVRSTNDAGTAEIQDQPTGPTTSIDSTGTCPTISAASDCDSERMIGIEGIFGFDSFKGVSDLQTNFGAVTGLNGAFPLPGFQKAGFGWQLGATYGGYDFDGRLVNNTRRSQQQAFVTTGLFRKASNDRRISFGVVYDMMINDGWGYDALEPPPNFGQLRAQVEVMINEVNSVGIYGCTRQLSHRYYYVDPQFGTIYLTDRPMEQLNFFWHHKFESGADSRIWFGLPEQCRIQGNGSLSDWIIGANVEVPFSNHLALYGNAQYVHPSASAGALASIESMWNVGAGIVWYIGNSAKSERLNGHCWTPYMPVANNSTFLVDEEIEYGR